MHAKKGFVLRQVCGEHIVVAEGKENIDYTNIISMNESSAYLWKEIQDKEFTAEDLAELLLQEYEVEADIAQKDSQLLVKQWKDAGIIE